MKTLFLSFMLWLFSTLLLALSGFGITSPVTLDMVNPLLRC